MSASPGGFNSRSRWQTHGRGVCCSAILGPDRTVGGATFQLSSRRGDLTSIDPKTPRFLCSLPPGAKFFSRGHAKTSEKSRVFPFNFPSSPRRAASDRRFTRKFPDPNARPGQLAAVGKLNAGKEKQITKTRKKSKRIFGRKGFHRAHL
jgi:hypothetical protein